MIKRNVIKFGYGDILAGCYNNIDNEWDNFILRLTCIKPPQEVGESVVGKEYEIVKTLVIKTNFDEVYRLRAELLEMVQSELKVIDFKDYTLDFTKYNIKSVYVVTGAIDKAIQMYLMPLAC